LYVALFRFGFENYWVTLYCFWSWKQWLCWTVLPNLLSELQETSRRFFCAIQKFRRH